MDSKTGNAHSPDKNRADLSISKIFSASSFNAAALYSTRAVHFPRAHFIIGSPHYTQPNISRTSCSQAVHLKLIRSFEIDHAYLDDWKPCRGEVLQAIPEPNNAVDKYAVCVLKDGEVVGHLKRGKRGRFAKTIFYFLEADQHSSCSVIIKADKAVNFGDGEGMQVPCKLRISGQEKFVNILKKELERLEK